VNIVKQLFDEALLSHGIYSFFLVVMTKGGDFHFSALRENLAFEGNGMDFKRFCAGYKSRLCPLQRVLKGVVSE